MADIPDGSVAVPLPNKADEAWAELLRLRAEAVRLGVAVEDAWPVERLRAEIVSAFADGGDEHVARVRPGDTLVVRLADPSWTREQLDEYRAEVVSRLPGVKVVFVVGADQMLVYRPET
jgi:hypothetical protein